MDARKAALTDAEIAEKIAERELATEKAKNKVIRSKFGMGILLLGVLIVTVPVVLTQTIAVIPALTGFGVIIVGGVLTDPDHFVRLAERFIDALPGGKN